MLIGLSGHLNSGKDTFYRIAKELEPKAERLAFADKLKEIGAAILGIPIELLDSLKLNENFFYIPTEHHYWADRLGHYVDVPRFNIRTYLQKLGTEAMRDCVSENFWVNQILPLTFKHDTRLCIVTDMRFPNEIERVRFLGGKLVRINRASVNVPRVSLQHASEQEFDLDLFDYVINNDGTMKEFELAVQGVLVDVGWLYSNKEKILDG